ncbi:MAG: hypothetical protein QW754_06240, partial [Thermoplasmata archaeon]
KRGIANKKQVFADRIRYIGKESNNFDDASVLGIDPEDYLESKKLKEFYDWVVKLKPKNIRERRYQGKL